METYQVKPGDSLSKISQQKYGDFSMVDEIARLNNISNINLIMPGQTLRLPVVQEAVVTSIIDTNGNVVATKKNWLPYLLGGLLVAGGIYYVVSRKKKGNKVLGLGSPSKKISKEEAKKLAIAEGVDFDKDFHEQSKGNELAEIAKKAGYRKPKSASGSTGKYFFEHLQKVK